MSTQRDDFTTFDIIKALGIPRERLQDWINRGFIKPSIPAEGQGTKAVFYRDDVYGLALFKSLIGQGFKRNKAAEIAGYLKKYNVLDDIKRIYLGIWSQGDETFTHGHADAMYILDHKNFPELDIKDSMLAALKESFVESGDEKLIERIEELELELAIHGIEYGTLRSFEPKEMIDRFFIDGKPITLEGKGSVSLREEWDNLLIVNFEKIRKKVDIALSGLG